MLTRFNSIFQILDPAVFLPTGIYSWVKNPEENDWSDCVMILLANDFPTLRNMDKYRILGLNEHTYA